MPLRLQPGFGHPDAFGDLRHMREELDRAFGSRRRGTTSEFPPLNVWSGEHDMLVTAEVPGVDTKDIDITVDGQVLTLKGSRRQPEVTANAAAHRRERGYGTFARSVTLSSGVDIEKVQAECRDGVLKIYLPRPESEKPKRIRISKG
jgi:HSP20 family protein